MSTSTPRVRRLLGAAATLCIAVGAIVGVASVASAAKPVATATATVTGDTALVQVSVNRAVKQIRTATCTVDGAAVACGAATTDGKKAATYSVSLADLAAGSHDLTISIRLTDGGRLTATTSFEVAGEATGPQAVCEANGGSFAEGYFAWLCVPMPDDEAGRFAVIEECQTTFFDDMGACVKTDFIGTAITNCNNSSPNSPLFSFSSTGDMWACSTDAPDEDNQDFIGIWCHADGGVFARQDDPDRAGYGLYTCTPV